MVSFLPSGPHPLRPYTYAVLALLLGASLGYWHGRQSQEHVIQDRNIQVDHTVVKDRSVVVTRTVHPDGTTTETTETRDHASTADHSSEITHTEVIPAPSPAQYSLGIRYQSAYSELISQAASNPYKGLEVSAGRRILGPVWLELGGGVERVTLGIRYDF